MERHCFQQLPDGYEKTLTLDLQKDTKLALVVNGLAVGIAAVMFAAGFLLMPAFTIFASLPALAAFLTVAVGVTLLSVMLPLIGILGTVG